MIKEKPQEPSLIQTSLKIQHAIKLAEKHAAANGEGRSSPVKKVKLREGS